MDGRQVACTIAMYCMQNVLHAMYYIIRKEDVGDLYHSLGPNCIMFMPTVGISLMCYKACKRILIEGEEDEEEIDDAGGKENKTA
jgi:solute carrier family 25 (mitochondrial phosphate transporter), member 23/24/25/41